MEDRLKEKLENADDIIKRRFKTKIRSLSARRGNEMELEDGANNQDRVGKKKRSMSRSRSKGFKPVLDEGQ